MATVSGYWWQLSDTDRDLIVNRRSRMLVADLSLPHRRGQTSIAWLLGRLETATSVTDKGILHQFQERLRVIEFGGAEDEACRSRESAFSRPPGAALPSCHPRGAGDISTPVHHTSNIMAETVGSPE